jgi:ABC-type dipeptide/oligopeptide/nickel transport system permease subunit
MRARYVVPAVVVAIACAAFAVSRDPEHLDPALSFCAPGASHPFGCGEAGVDLLALVSHAILRGSALAVVVAIVGLVVGAPLGAGAALVRGRFERAVDRACDLVQAMPSFLLALAVLSAVRSPSRVHLAVVFSLTAWAPFARLALAQTRVLRSASFIDAARALGVRGGALLVRHVLPNSIGILAVQLGATAGAIVVSEAALSFVGLGPRGGVSLGSALEQGVACMLFAPHVMVVAALAIVATSASVIAAGRAVE